MNHLPRRVLLFVLVNEAPRAHFNRLLSDGPHSAVYAFDGADGFDRFLEAKPDMCFIAEGISRISTTILCQLIREHERGQNVGLFILSDDPQAPERLVKLLDQGVSGFVGKSIEGPKFTDLLSQSFANIKLPQPAQLHNEMPETPQEKIISSPDPVVIDPEDALDSSVNSDSVVLELKPPVPLPLSQQEIVELTPSILKSPATELADAPTPEFPETTDRQALQNNILEPNEAANAEVTNPAKSIPFADTADTNDGEDDLTPARQQGYLDEVSGVHEAYKSDDEAENSGSENLDGAADAELTPPIAAVPTESAPFEPETPGISNVATNPAARAYAADEPELPTPVAEQQGFEWDDDSARLAASGGVFDQSAAQESDEVQSEEASTDESKLDSAEEASATATPITATSPPVIAAPYYQDELAEAEAAGLLPLSDEERDSMTVRQAISGSQLGGRLTRRVLALYRLLDSVDYYQLLGVAPGVDNDELQLAFHALALEYHPDRFYPLADGFIKERITALFTRMCEAYSVLAKRELRAHYDIILTGRGSGPPPRYPLGDSDSKTEEQNCEAHSPVGRKYLRLAVAAMARGDLPAAQINLTFALGHEPENEAIRQRLSSIEKNL